MATGGSVNTDQRKDGAWRPHEFASKFRNRGFFKEFERYSDGRLCFEIGRDWSLLLAADIRQRKGRKEPHINLSSHFASLKTRWK